MFLPEGGVAPMTILSTVPDSSCKLQLVGEAVKAWLGQTVRNGTARSGSK